MTVAQRRVRGAVALRGDAYTVGVDSRVGVFSVLAMADAEGYLTAAEIGAASLPLYAAYVAFDDATVVTDMVVWNGLSLTVKRVIELRSRDVTVAKLLVLV
ncbi:MAG: hypothetical protein IH944_01220 [Armatimonadetes bacterium]|nr:hypothetical protein [Armatimonadota bacterium]